MDLTGKTWGEKLLSFRVAEQGVLCFVGSKTEACSSCRQPQTGTSSYLTVPILCRERGAASWRINNYRGLQQGCGQKIMSDKGVHLSGQRKYQGLPLEQDFNWPSKESQTIRKQGELPAFCMEEPPANSLREVVCEWQDTAGLVEV